MSPLMGGGQGGSEKEEEEGVIFRRVGEVKVSEIMK